ncbi:MAG TPA: hypothetical protein DCE41_18900 [Cytophagales bacterium]|nr:hypothetical protein [Cytophagales bacterium]HAA22121.1 hypothetical protein [Cytophagales bacterium]HAP60824.1 hypothetical protein [Cytophagales bacterium]
MQSNNKISYLDAGQIDRGRPAGRPPKTNRKIEFMKKVLRAAQYPAPRWTAQKVWAEFTRPGRTRWNEKQEALVEQAHVDMFDYQGTTLTRYRWGSEGPKVLLVHGWRSKIVDFRKLIETLVNQGFVVEGVDFRAHGRSEGSHSALPEFYDALTQHHKDWGPYHAVMGYSLGGLASGLMTAHLAKELQPQQLFLFAAPPYPYYFFEDIINELNLGKRVLKRFAGFVEEYYNREIHWWDLRSYAEHLNHLDVHLIYDEHDETVPLTRGQQLLEHLPEASFLHGKGLGHYKIISHEGILDYVTRNLKVAELVR